MVKKKVAWLSKIMKAIDRGTSLAWTLFYSLHPAISNPLAQAIPCSGPTVGPRTGTAILESPVLKLCTLMVVAFVLLTFGVAGATSWKLCGGHSFLLGTIFPSSGEGFPRATVPNPTLKCDSFE
jgi:hypothetical protein